MITFKAKDLKKNEYTLTLISNDGKEQLIIILSASLMVCRVQIDGIPEVMFKTQRRLSNAELIDRLNHVIAAWVKIGGEPSGEQLEKMKVEQFELMNKIRQYYLLG